MVSTPPNPQASHQNAEPRRVSLTTLRGGDRARVHTRDMRCEDCDLLNAMGLTDRCELRVCRIGQPCIVQVASTRLGLSREVAGRIMVEPLTNEG